MIHSARKKWLYRKCHTYTNPCYGQPRQRLACAGLAHTTTDPAPRALSSGVASARDIWGRCHACCGLAWYALPEAHRRRSCSQRVRENVRSIWPWLRAAVCENYYYYYYY